MCSIVSFISIDCKLPRPYSAKRAYFDKLKEIREKIKEEKKRKIQADKGKSKLYLENKYL